MSDHILIAEDEPMARWVLQQLLERSGYKVQAAQNGAQALQAIQAPDAPAIAILDWMMPVLSGIEVCGQLDPKDRPYIIILSARSAGEDIAQALDAGADAYLTKPINKAELFAYLRVAERTVALRREMREQIAAMRQVLERNHLLYQLINPEPETPAPVAAEPYEAPASLEQAIAGKIDVMLAAFRDLKLPVALAVDTATLAANPSAPLPPPTDVELTLWSGLVEPSSGTWIDLVLGCSSRTAAAFFVLAMGRAHRHQNELQHFLSEIFTRLIERLRQAVAPTFKVHPLPWTRLQPAGLPPDPLLALPLTLKDYEATLCFYRSESAVSLPPTELQPNDVTCEAYPRDVQNPFVAALTPLNERYIYRLCELSSHFQSLRTLTVLKPTRVARGFLG